MTINTLHSSSHRFSKFIPENRATTCQIWISKEQMEKEDEAENETGSNSS